MQRKIHKIDATGQALGRLAVQIAVILRGKGKANFQRYLDVGDAVEVSGIRGMKFTGKKMKQKKYYKHSGYPGGLRVQTLEENFKKNPSIVLRQAVLGMLPKNRMRAEFIKHLIIK